MASMTMSVAASTKLKILIGLSKGAKNSSVSSEKLLLYSDILTSLKKTSNGPGPKSLCSTERKGIT